MGQMQEDLQAKLQSDIAQAGEVTIAGLEPTHVKLRQLPPLKTQFFFQRRNGTIFTVDEQQAALIRKRGDPHVIIGVSDGATARKYIQDHIDRFGEIPIKDADRINQEAWDAELAVAKQHVREPVFEEWNYPDSSLPPDLRQQTRQEYGR